MEKLIHTLKPIFDINSKILILGSFPSIKSRNQNMYFSHPQNRFWKVLSKLFCENIPITNEEKIKFLLKHKIALYDVVYSCEIIGSSDASIKNVVPNNLSIFKQLNIKKVFTLGKTSSKLYKKYFDSNFIELPSTSPANAKFSLEDLTKKFEIIKIYLKE